MKRFVLLIVVLVTMLTACASPAMTLSPAAPGLRILTIFAASSLTDAFTEIGRNFEAANPGVTVALNFAGSQALRAQLEEGAVADVFAPANMTEMDTLVTDNLVLADTIRVFLTNQLLVILPADNPANIQSLDDLANTGIKLVLAAEEVPVGKYARQVLDNLNAIYGMEYKDEVLANVVSNEDNVKQVVTKVQLGEADAGIVYISDVVAVPELKTIEIPGDYNVIARYPIAPLTATQQPDLAARFIAYIFSADGQAILQKWGFAPVNP